MHLHYLFRMVKWEEIEKLAESKPGYSDIVFSELERRHYEQFRSDYKPGGSCVSLRWQHKKRFMLLKCKCRQTDEEKDKIYQQFVEKEFKEFRQSVEQFDEDYYQKMKKEAEDEDKKIEQRRKER